MTPNQGDPPNQPRGRRSSGNEYQQPPARQPQQPPTGQFQSQPAQQGQQGQPMRQYQQSTPQGAPTQAPPQQQSGGVPAQPPAQGAGARQAGGVQQQGSRGQAPQPQQGAARSRGRSQVSLRPVRVEDVVQTDVVTAQRDTPIATVVAMMAEEDVGSVVVVENDRPVGILTDRKIALSLENTPDIANKQTGDLISGDLVTATTDMNVFDALQRLSDESIRRLPIVDDDGSLQGIVSLDDILVLLASELDKAGEAIEGQLSRL